MELLFSENELARLNEALAFMSRSFETEGLINRIRNRRAMRKLGITVTKRRFTAFCYVFFKQSPAIWAPAQFPVTLNLTPAHLAVMRDALHGWLFIWNTVKSPEPQLVEEATMAIPAARHLIARIDALIGAKKFKP